MTRNSLGKGLFLTTLRSRVMAEESWGRNTRQNRFLEAGTKAEALEKKTPSGLFVLNTLIFQVPPEQPTELWELNGFPSLKLKAAFFHSPMVRSSTELSPFRGTSVFGCLLRDETMTKSKGMVYFLSHSQTAVYRWGNQDGTQAGQELRRSHGGCCPLACSPRLTQPSILFNPGPPAQGWHCLQWAGPCIDE